MISLTREQHDRNVTIEKANAGFITVREATRVRVTQGRGFVTHDVHQIVESALRLADRELV